MGDFGRAAAVDRLTQRELEILRLIAEGLANQAIAERLVISLGTVKWYVKQIYSKLQVGSRTQAVLVARAAGLLSGIWKKVESFTPPHNLPLQPTPFIGRVEELAALTQRLRDPACRLLTVVGPGGIGKTRLALQAAEQQIATFPNGVYFVSLAPLRAPESIVEALAEAIRFSISPGSEPRQQLLDYLRLKQILLVLDNFEHLLAGVSLVAEILERAPGIKILATSRERLNLRAEVIFSVDGLTYPSQATDVLTEFTAVALFVQCARQVQADFLTTESNLTWAAAICRQVHGMPLAILLAAAWAGALSVEEIAHEIMKSLDFLELDQRDQPERQRSLRAAFDHSWKLLADAEREVFRRLSIFPGNFSRQAAEQIADASLKTLGALVNKSLIRFSTDTRRYELHELLRHYATEKLVDAGEAEAVGARHFDFFATLAEDGEAKLHSKDLFLWRGRFDADYDNLRSALGYGLTHIDRLQSGLQLAGDLAWFWLSTHRIQEGREWLKKLLRHPGAELETSARAGALYGASILSFFSGDLSALRVYMEEQGYIARMIGHNRLLGQALYGLSALYMEEHNYPEALSSALESVALLKEFGNFYHPASLQCVGRTYYYMGDDAAARPVLEECLALATQGGHLWTEAFIRETLAPLLFRTGKSEEAIEHLKRLAQFWETLGDKSVYIRVARELVEVYIAQGNYEDAYALQHERLALCRDSGLDHQIADNLLMLGNIARLRQAEDEASTCFEESLSLYRQLSDQAGVEACLAALKPASDIFRPDPGQ